MKAPNLLQSFLSYCRSSSWFWTSSICSSKVWNLESICWNLDSHSLWRFLWFSAKLSIQFIMSLSKGDIEVILSPMWSVLGLAPWVSATGSSRFAATSVSSSSWVPLGPAWSPSLLTHLWAIFVNLILLREPLLISLEGFIISASSSSISTSK